jgi:hypothetical protein
LLSFNVDCVFSISAVITTPKELGRGRRAQLHVCMFSCVSLKKLFVKAWKLSAFVDELSFCGILGNGHVLLRARLIDAYSFIAIELLVIITLSF